MDVKNHETRCRRVATVLAAGLVALACTVPGTAAQETGFENLKVLPPDISRSELNQVMIANLSGLGLPRRGGEGCLFCHVGDMDVQRSEWDYASDEKLPKRKAREMLAMTAEINERLAGLEERVAPDLEAGCYTCHKGRTDPRSLRDLMVEAYLASGIDSASTVYRGLRSRYFASDAYDFRPSTLGGFAAGLAARGAFEDALVLSRMNEEFYPGDASVRRGTLILEIQRAAQEEGTDAALARFERALQAEPEGTMSFSVLDNVAWPLYRTDRQDDAIRLFRRNREAFPDDYVANESLATALFSAGEQEEGLAILEAWIEEHPDDDVARRVLINLRERG